MLKLEISSEIKRPVEEVFAYLTDPVNRRELIDERSYDTAILLALGGGSLLGRRHRWFRRAIHLLRPLESEKCRLDEDEAAQRCVNPDEFSPSSLRPYLRSGWDTQGSGRFHTGSSIQD